MIVTKEHAQFADLVHRMRMAQAHYFRLRRNGHDGTAQALAVSKRLEAEVDAAVMEISRVRPSSGQGELFAAAPSTTSALTHGR